MLLSNEQKHNKDLHGNKTPLDVIRGEFYDFQLPHKIKRLLEK